MISYLFFTLSLHDFNSLQPYKSDGNKTKVVKRGERETESTVYLRPVGREWVSSKVE